MKNLNKSEIDDFLNQTNFDIKKTGNARWIDQKCAPDVISIVADCIINYIETENNNSFTVKNIWFSNYSVDNIQAIFKKVGADEKAAKHEYDKFFGQPIKLLAYAGVLLETKEGNKNVYKVVNSAILEYLSIRERNALEFLNVYIRKVLNDSGVFNVFESFFEFQTKQNYSIMKETFAKFTIKHTAIGSRTSMEGENENAGVVECNRIFIKVLNPMAFYNNSFGTIRGKLSKDVITYDLLMYNRDNFRDIYSEKPKSITRNEYAQKIGFIPNAAYFSYLSAKAKQQVRLYNNIHRKSTTELYDERHVLDKAVHIHHIFTESEYPEISSYYENLIALTPTQHLGYAHIDGNTRTISKDYQRQCLIAKTTVIKENLVDKVGEPFYEFDNFKYVLVSGLDDSTYYDVELNDYDGLIIKINLAY